MSLIFEAGLSQLSFGQVSYNILRECQKRNLDIGFFPIGGISLDCFQPKKEFVDYLQEAINRRYDLLKREMPSYKLWHLQGSDNLRTPNQTLLTFYECSEPTSYEKTITSLQKKTLFSSNYAAEKFVECGNVGTFSCGFDPDLHETGKKYLEGKIHFSYTGKFEHRKQTREVIKAWVKRYGNNSKYSLTLLTFNPFFSQNPDENHQANARLIQEALGEKRIWNCNILPPLKTNAEVCELINATDIDLSGLSGAEGWGLPSFNATALGRWSIVLNHTSHKDWATPENCILVEPDGTRPVQDGVFFKKDSPVNQGIFYTLSEEKMIEAFELAEKKFGQKNVEGLKLKDQFTYSKTLDQILSHL